MSANAAFAQNFNKKLLENKWITVSVNGNNATKSTIVIGFSETNLTIDDVSTPYKLNGSEITFNAGPKKVIWEILKLTKKQLIIRNEDKLIIKMKKI